VDILFLDANVLFSAAYKETSRLGRLWEVPEVELVTSAYVVEEVERNLRDRQRSERLQSRIASVRIVSEAPDLETLRSSLLPDLKLPPDDLPILVAAIACGATHLLTGDRRHFGPLWCHRMVGVHPMRPAVYLADRAAS
jgi:predicted nucleic acid-binding protein